MNIKTIGEIRENTYIWLLCGDLRESVERTFNMYISNNSDKTY